MHPEHQPAYQKGQKMQANPILLEIVEGTIESSRKEMELQIERTARSTVIREQHDYRAR